MGQSGEVVNFESKEKKKKVMVIIVRSVVLVTAACLCHGWPQTHFLYRHQIVPYGQVPFYPSNRMGGSFR